MKITELAFASYPVTDIARARAFYEGVLGLEVTTENNMGDGGHWIEYDIGATTLGIGRAEDWKPGSDGCSVALEVEDFDSAISELRKAGTPFRMGPFETPVCHMAMVNDPDGNTVIIHRRKPGHR